MNNLSYLPLLEKYIAEKGAAPRFTVPFLTRQNKYNVELQNWKDYQDLKKAIIIIRQSGIRAKSPDCFPCLTHIPNIPIIYDQSKYRYLTKSELLNLQSFPQNYQFPTNYSLTKIASLLGNSLNLAAVKHFLQDKNFSDLNFVDLFAGLGGFHLAVKELTNKCVLVVDKNKNCQEVYQLNFPTAPFLLGDINNKEIQKKIIATDFDLLCAGFPCQSYSRARKKQGVSLELTSLLPIIRKKKPRYLLLENVPNFLTNSESSKFLSSLLVNYQLHLALINPKQLGVKQKRPRIFIWGHFCQEKNHE